MFLTYLLSSPISSLDTNFAGLLLMFLVVPYFTFVWLISDVGVKLASYSWSAIRNLKPLELFKNALSKDC